MQIIDDNKLELFDEKTPLNIRYTRLVCPVGISRCEPQYTVFLNLDKDEDVIFKGFQSSAKHHINQCIKKDNPIIEFIENPDQKLIEEFLVKFKEFAEDKDSDIMRSVIGGVEKGVNLWKKHKILVFSSIYSSDYPNYKIYHAHQINPDNKSVRMMCSISSFRHLEPEVKNMIGRLNRLLHYKDFLKFKELGYKTYDMGGVSIQPDSGECNSISRFKMTLLDTMKKYYYVDFVSDCYQNYKKQVNLISNNQEEYNIALNIVNQLSDKYLFYINNSSMGGGAIPMI